MTERSDGWPTFPYSLGEIGIDAATCALWDEANLPLTTQLTNPYEELPGPPVAVTVNIGDDIDGGIEAAFASEGDDAPAVAVRIVFVDDVDEIDAEWQPVGRLDVSSGALVIADPFCTPVVPYRQRLKVVPGSWEVETLVWEGDMEAIRLRPIAPG